MLNINHHFLPVMSSKAGLSITPENWEEVQVSAGVFYLDSLLLKPGQELLKKIEHFGPYIGWKGEIIINASLCKANKEGIVTLISPYDGSRVKLHHSELLELLIHLKPKAVILPPSILQHVPEFWSYWSEAIIPFFCTQDLLNQDIQGQTHGVYMDLTEFPTKKIQDEQLKKWSHLPLYLMGSCVPEDMQDLIQDSFWIESDAPASLALEAKVFNQRGLISLKEIETSKQFETIDPNCVCPTCNQGLTKAYLHHLYFHTPLLTYRFLIQHNIYWSIKNGLEVNRGY